MDPSPQILPNPGFKDEAADEVQGHFWVSSSEETGCSFRSPVPVLPPFLIINLV